MTFEWLFTWWKHFQHKHRLLKMMLLFVLCFGFIYSKIYYYYIPVFDIQFKKYTVGRLLLCELLRSSFDARLDKFDFMSGGDDYKSEWCPQEEKLYFVSAYPKNIMGFGAFLIFKKGVMVLKKLLGKAW